MLWTREHNALRSSHGAFVCRGCHENLAGWFVRYYYCLVLGAVITLCRRGGGGGYL